MPINKKCKLTLGSGQLNGKYSNKEQTTNKKLLRINGHRILFFRATQFKQNITRHPGDHQKKFGLKESQQAIRLQGLEIPALLDPFFGERPMSISRRNFLFRSATAALLAGIPLAALKPVSAFQKQRQPAPPIQSGVSIPIEAQAAPIFYMTKSTFESQLNTLFNVQVGTALNGVPIRLVEIRDLVPPSEKAMAASTRREAFALVFRGKKRDPFKQNTYTFKHDALGTFEMFIAPVGNDATFQYYEAVFNRLH